MSILVERATNIVKSTFPGRCGKKKLLASTKIRTSCILLALSAASASAPALHAQTPRIIEEILVIAQKRQEPAQAVPLAVTAISGDMIRESGMLTMVQLTELHPSVSFDVAQNYQNASLKIRGIGTVGNARNFEGSVGVFIDGVYRPRSIMAISDINDISQLEVLRGPQGTLFGKNTVAGTLNLQSNRPSTDEFDADIEFRAGDYDSTYFAGMVNMPLSDSSALRLSGSVNQREAFFTSPDNGHDYNAIDRYNVKAQYQFTPSDDLEILLIADYSKSDSDCCWGSPFVVHGPTAPVIQTYAALNGLSFVPTPDAERKRSGSLNTLPGDETTDYGLNFQVNKRFSMGTLKSITAYRDWEITETNTDPDFGPADLLQFDEPAEIDFFSQEFNFSMDVGGSDLLLGAYYSREDFSSYRDVRTGANADDYLNFIISSGGGAQACLPPVLNIDCLFPVGIAALTPDGSVSIESYQQDSESWAVFGHTVTPLNENWSLIAGLRYSEEDKDGEVDNAFWYDSAIVRFALAGMGIPDDGTHRNGFDLIGAPFSPSFSAKTQDDELTGTVSLQYRPTANVNLYAGYHRGYKASGINLFREAIITDTTTYDPESADSFELGMKLSYLDGRARTNVAVFHTDFSDMQINFFEDLTFRTENTAESSTEGIEVENVFQLSYNLRVDFDLTYMDAKFDRIDTPFLEHLEGRETPRAPDLSGVLALNWERPVNNQLSIFARTMASYTGDHYVSPAVPNERKSDSYVITDASVGLRNDEDNWEVLLSCTNCTDETYRTILINSPFQPGSLNAYLGPPKQVGLTFRMGF